MRITQLKARVRNRRLLVAISSLLLGCASTQHQQFTSFPTSTELGTPRRLLSSYEQARVDFQRAAKGLRPRYALRQTALYDGGTTFYRGRGYDLTVWKRFSSADGVTYLRSGPEIHF